MSQATLSGRPYRNSNLFSGYYLDERLREREAWDCDEAARETMEELRALYEQESGLVEGYGEDALIDNWIEEVLSTLGFGTHVETTLPDGGGFVDVLLFSDTEARRSAAETYLATDDTADLFEGGVGIVEAKQWDADFSARFNDRRPYRNASHQIKHYLENTPSEMQWGVLTNGRQWRLYGTKDYETQTYYEVDLPELLERGDLEAFKYFYLFFRPAAFRAGPSGTFHDSVWAESETAARELGADLQDNVFTALRVLGEGFVAENDLDIEAGDEESLAELKEQSLVLLYRLMFVLYAESRGLIDPDDPEKQDEYETEFSLSETRQEVLEEVERGDAREFEAFSEVSTSMWNRLSRLFELIDSGNEKLEIPAYNGGLFDPEEHAFLDSNRITDRYMAEVVFRLSTTRNDDGEYVPADYADLDTRHLGSIYEGLLEHEFRIADTQQAAVEGDGGQVWRDATEVSAAAAIETVDAGELYVVNDEGERKATGAYYTPDYVVTYIVEETVDPLIEDIEAELRDQGLESGTPAYYTAFRQRVEELKILDPAMGSGHFLTKATGYLAETVLEEARELESASLIDEAEIRREVAKECIYGVDVNGMAVELGKLSMWLETLATDQPLAFLDHHLKAGNSLVGSDIGEVLSTEDETMEGQTTLGGWMAQARRQALEHVMDLMGDLLAIDNETLSDVKRMEEVYAEIRADPRYQHLLEMADVHTAARFGLDVPEDADERMARALRDDEWAEIEETDWFKSAQALAAEESFFHWELEFPDAFYDSEGERKEDAGFDAVVGNPPYVSAWNRDLSQDNFFRARYHSASGHYDMYCLFVEKSVDLLQSGGMMSMIIPDTFCGQAYAENGREVLTTDVTLETVLDLRDQDVFDGIQVKNIIFTAQGSSGEAESVTVKTPKEGATAQFEISHTFPYEILSSENEYRIPLSEAGLNIGIREKLSSGTELDDVFYVSKGMEPHTADGDSKYNFINKESPADGMKAYIEGKHIERWRIHSNWYINYSPDEHKRPVFREMFEAKKIVGARTIGAGRPMFAVDERGFYNNEKVLNAVPYDELHNIQDGRSQVNISEEELKNGEKFSAYAVVSVLNSSATTFVFREIESGALDFFPRHLKKISVPVPDTVPAYDFQPSTNTLPERPSRDSTPAELYEMLHSLGKRIIEQCESRAKLNVDLLDYLGNYEEGPALPDIGLFQPGDADSILHEASEDNDDHLRLRIGTVRATRESEGAVRIEATARYRPDEDEDFVESEFHEAFTLTDLERIEADLVEAFVPVAAEEAGGFAGYRENATKTNSLLDRLKAMTLPDPEDVADDLERYRKTKERADELDAKIERTDDLIDDIVYDLYGLSEEEIEIVEEAVGE